MNGNSTAHDDEIVQATLSSAAVAFQVSVMHTRIREMQHQFRYWESWKITQVSQPPRIGRNPDEIERTPVDRQLRLLYLHEEGERGRFPDDDASSASSATAIPNGAPLPPPRRTVPSDPSSSAGLPPLHPSSGKGPISASPKGAKLYSAINKVKNALPLTQVRTGMRNAPPEKARNVAAGTRGYGAAGTEGNDYRTTAPASPLPPPPVRTIALGDRLPCRRWNASEASPQDEDAANLYMGSTGFQKPPLGQALVPSPIPASRKGLDDLSDSSRSNRRPPFAPFANKDGDVLGLPAPHKSVYAFAGGVLCLGKQSVDVYRLADLQERTPNNVRRHRFHHHHRHRLSTDSS
ncbi:hypothetical protein FRB90_006603 [Tulasnella sp. 427]|nr:hypothetical protein FRB90_006603 [Tulasnella sp. 427]